MITEINGGYRHFGMPRTIKLMHKPKTAEG